MMEELSREYGWTPSQIREQEYDDIMNYWQIIGLRRLKAKQEQRKHKPKK